MMVVESKAIPAIELKRVLGGTTESFDAAKHAAWIPAALGRAEQTILRGEASGRSMTPGEVETAVRIAMREFGLCRQLAEDAVALVELRRLYAAGLLPSGRTVAGLALPLGGVGQPRLCEASMIPDWDARTVPVLFAHRRCRPGVIGEAALRPARVPPELFGVEAVCEIARSPYGNAVWAAVKAGELRGLSAGCLRLPSSQTVPRGFERGVAIREVSLVEEDVFGQPYGLVISEGNSTRR